MSDFAQDPQQRSKLTKRVTIVGAVVNIILSVLKIAFGWLGHSQALIADGIHSLSDVITDFFVLFAAHHATAEPDEDHPYGHLRFETIATFILAVLLVLTAIGISWSAFERLLSDQPIQIPATYTIAIALLSVLVKEALYWYTIKIARLLQSDMLKANAWHHRSDSISSIVVVVGLVGAVMGYPYLDGIAAFVVALMILHVAWEFGWSSLQELADRGVDEETLEKIRKQITTVDGVQSLHMLRTRLSAGTVSIDAHILVAPEISVSEGHCISDSVVGQIKQKCANVTDVTVHVDPEDDEINPPSRGLPLRVETIKEITNLWQGIDCIDKNERILLHYLEGKISIELYLPLSCFVSIEQTKELTENLQAALDKDRYRSVCIYYG